MLQYRIFALTLVLALAALWGQAATKTALTGQMLPAGALTPALPDAAQVYHVQKADARPVIDGKGDEWTGIPAITLGENAIARGWDGMQDLHGSLRMLWDERGMYFYLEVADDVHSVPKADGDWWENDSCQFAFDPYLDGPVGSFGDDEQSYLVGDTVRGPILAAYRTPGAGNAKERVLKDRTVKMSNRPDGARAFEWMMPWEQLAPLSPWPLGRCGFTFSLNDNDGKGYKGGLRWTPGLIDGQDASQFGQLVFDGVTGTRQVVRGLRPEVKIAEQARSTTLNIAGAEPWNTGRLLVCLPEGGSVTAVATIYAPGKRYPVATSTVTGEVPADQPVVFTWDLNSLPDGQYEIEYEAKKLAPPQRMSFYIAHVDALRAQSKALRDAYGIDRPWDPMPAASPVIRKHRGLVAMALQLLEDDSFGKKMRNVDAYDQYVSALTYCTGMINALNEGKDFLALQRGRFWGAYYSGADGSGQSFVISLPSDYLQVNSYPLIVNLHGAGAVPAMRPGPTGKVGYIMVQPWGRGCNSSYAGLGENDVLEIINYMKTWYHIDSDQVYITGGSMGGHGTWRLATRHPDLFAAAAPVCGWVGANALENLRYVPVFDQHGARDWTVPVDMSRVAVRALQQLGYPVLYKEHPEAGHDINGTYPTNDWMLELRRPDEPRCVTYTGEQPDSGAYWLTLRQFIDIHQRASVNAQVIGEGEQQGVSMTTANLSVIELDLKRMPINRRNDLLLQIDDQFLRYARPLPERLFLVHSVTGWAVFQGWEPAASPMRPYRVGGLTNLYTGEPLMVIYGTQCGEERKAALLRIANSLSRFNGSSDEDMPAGRFPVKSDREVTADDMRNYNMVIVGGANDNVLAAMLQSRLPFAITANNTLVAGGCKPLSMEGGWYRLCYYNPLAPQRLMLLLGFDAKRDLAIDVRKELSYVWENALGDAPDLWAVSPAGRRNLQFTDGWQWQVLPVADRQAPKAAIDQKLRIAGTLRAMQAAARADFALGLLNLPYQPAADEDTRLADLAITRAPLATVVGGMTGEELLALKNAEKMQWQLYPALDATTIDRTKMYRVVLDAWDVWDTGAYRRQNLHNPEPGPQIPQAVLLQEYDRTEK